MQHVSQLELEASAVGVEHTCSFAGSRDLPQVQTSLYSKVPIVKPCFPQQSPHASIGSRSYFDPRLSSAHDFTSMFPGGSSTSAVAFGGGGTSLLCGGGTTLLCGGTTSLSAFDEPHPDVTVTQSSAQPIRRNMGVTLSEAVTRCPISRDSSTKLGLISK